MTAVAFYDIIGFGLDFGVVALALALRKICKFRPKSPVHLQKPWIMDHE